MNFILNKNTLAMSLKTLSVTSLLTFGLVQNAMAASTMVTDAVGTQELWTFQEVLGAQKLTSKVNQVDGKGITQTWDANGNKLSRTDAEGRLTTYTYNATNQKTAMTEASGTPQARTTRYEYVNADIDLVTKTTSPSIYAGSLKEVINTYDANLNITAVTINGFDAAGAAVTRATTFAHDVYGKVIEINGPRTDVSDITTLEYYDCNTGAGCGQLKTVTNAAGHISTYDSYDGAARLLRMTDPNGVVTTYTYHPRGWVLSMTQTPPTGVTRVTTYDYDNVGQMIKTTLPDGTEQNYVYDAAHDLREISDNLGNKVTYTYDAKGNRTDELVFDPDGTLVRSTITTYDIRNFIESINRGGSVTQMINDAVGNLSTQTDPNLNPETDHSFDALDRLTNTVDALTNNSGYQYNVADQLEQVTAPNGAVTQYEYDDLGNQTKEVSADRGTTVYGHDDAGNVTSMTDARGITASYQYDALNRLTNVTYPTASENITYTYDVGCANPVGRLCQAQDDSGVEQYDYDAWGNVTRCEKEERDATGTAIGTYVTSYQYDEANRVLQTTYPSGRTVTTSRDAIGRLIGLTSTGADAVTTNIISGRTYRADGVWTEQVYGNGLIQTKTYDQQGRLTNHVAGDYSRQYDYDANGNITKAAANDNAFDTDYDYDVLDRLTQESDAIKSLVRGFAYDGNGNREQASIGTQSSSLSYTANSNRLDNIDGNTVTLDASGRTLADDAGRSYVYNDAGRLNEVSVNGAVIGQYTYNNQQLRTQKTANGGTTVYHYDTAGNVIAESSGTETTQEYLYADGERVATFAAASTNAAGNTPPVIDPISLSGEQAYGGSQDQSSTGAVVLSNNDTRIALNGNRWRAVPLNYTVTDNTVLEFDFASTAQGEIHGIGLDADLNISANRTFMLYGTQNWGIRDFKTYSGSGTTHYRIPVGQFYQGAMAYLGLTMDDDANKAAHSEFSNIKVYEQAPNTANTNGLIDLSAYAPYGGSQDQASSGPVSLDADGALRLKGNRWQRVPISVDITPTTELRFEFKSDTQGEVHGIGVDNDNNINGGLTFAVWGTQNWGNRGQYGYTGAGSYQSYSIPIGQVIAAGSYSYLTITMDDDANRNGESVFRNVEFVDPSNPADPIEPAQQAGVQYYVNDHLMTPQRLVNDASETSWAATYDAFGQASIETELVTNHHRFPGQYYDAETGLYYNWNRYYDPETGRYVTSDPIGLQGGMNTYAYVYGNPLIYYDFMGLDGSNFVLNPATRIGGRILQGAKRGGPFGLGLGIGIGIGNELFPGPISPNPVTNVPTTFPSDKINDDKFCPPEDPCEKWYKTLKKIYDLLSLMNDSPDLAAKKRDYNQRAKSYNLTCPKKVPTFELGPTVIK